jgi:hypothetical protein
MNLRKLALASLLTATAGIPAVTMADSELDFGASASASAELDFQVLIPQFVFFQVGASPVPGNVDSVVFDLSTTETGSGVDVADASGPVDVVLRSNAQVTITAPALAGSGPLAAGSTEISAVASNVSIPVPAFGSSAAPVAGPINATGTWTFTYDNANVYPNGDYQTTVTYTAATP